MMLKLIVLSMLLIPIFATIDEQISNFKENKELTKNEEFLIQGFDWIGDRFFGILQSFVPHERTSDIEGRKRKKLKLNKYVFPLIIGFLLIKSVILPLALKGLAILSGKAVVLSLMSLILAAIVGLRTVANGGGASAQNKIDVDTITKYKRKDILDYIDHTEDDPYKYYADNRRKRK